MRYPIGTKIIYKPKCLAVSTAAKADIGKTGHITGYYNDRTVEIILNDSCMAKRSFREGGAITVGINNVEKVAAIGEQLEFDFVRQG